MSLSATKPKIVDDRLAATALYLKKRLKELESSKKVVDREVEDLQQKLYNVRSCLSLYIKVKSHYLNSLYCRQARAKKVVVGSLAVSLTSLTAGIHCNLSFKSSEILPWIISVGLGSLLCTLIFSKDVWLSFKDHAQHKRILKFVLDSSMFDFTNTSEFNSKEKWTRMSLPEELLTICLSDKEYNVDRRRLFTD